MAGSGGGEVGGRMERGEGKQTRRESREEENRRGRECVTLRLGQRKKASTVGNLNRLIERLC